MSLLRSLGIFAARCYKDASPTGLKPIRVNSPAATGASTAGEIRVKKIRVPSVFHPWLKNSNAKSPKRPTQTAIGGGVRPHGPTGNHRRSSGRESAPSKKTARKIMSRFTSAATNKKRPLPAHGKGRLRWLRQFTHSTAASAAGRISSSCRRWRGRCRGIRRRRRAATGGGARPGFPPSPPAWRATWWSRPCRPPA